MKWWNWVLLVAQIIFLANSIFIAGRRFEFWKKQGTKDWQNAAQMAMFENAQLRGKIDEVYGYKQIMEQLDGMNDGEKP